MHLIRVMDQEYENQVRLQGAIRRAADERRCHTCRFMMDERDMGAPVVMCGRVVPAVPCVEERASLNWPSCGPYGLFWSWTGPIFA